MMTSIKQKTDNYCFVACMASALLDEGFDKLQKLIVERYPKELQKGEKKEGVPDNLTDIQNIVVGLNLATSIDYKEHSTFSARDAQFLLLENKGKERWVFIGLAPTNTHLVRLFEIRNNGITIMEPLDGTAKDWDWRKFEEQYRSLLILNTI